MKVLRRDGMEAICEYFLAPSPNPPIPSIVFKWGNFFFKAANRKKPRFLTSLCCSKQANFKIFYIPEVCNSGLGYTQNKIPCVHAKILVKLLRKQNLKKEEFLMNLKEFFEVFIVHLDKSDRIV